MTEATYYTAESESGDVVCDPSEDALYMRISDLVLPENSFLTVEPAGGGAEWYVVVSLLPDGAYEVEYRDARRSEHRIAGEADASRIAREITIWLRGAVRFPG